MIPYRDQWNFLTEIRRTSVQTLDELFNKLTSTSQIETIKDGNGTDKKLILQLNSGICIKKALLNKTIINFVRDELNFPNLDYWLKKRLGKSVYQTEKFFRLIEENNEEIILPRGFLSTLTDFLRTQEMFFKVQDDRVVLSDVNYSSNIQLKNEQEAAVLQATEVEQGVIVAPPGSGKTIIGLELIARHRQPALILTHRKQIMDQWIERIQTFLGISKAHIGRLDGVKKKVGEIVTVAMLQSLARKEDLKDLRDKFGLVIIDECHHIPAKTFREVVSGFNARYWYGLTATPKRKHNDEKLIYLFIGDIITELLENNAQELVKPAKKIESIAVKNVIIRQTNLEIPFSFKSDNYQLLARTISFDQLRNNLVLEDIKKSALASQKTLVLSERKEHLEMLNMYLKGVCETILVTGDDSAVSRKKKFAQIQSGHYQVIFSTGQLIGEGMDMPSIQTIILAFPIAFEGKLAQYIGRIRGDKKTVYDYHDIKTSFLDRQFKKRKKFYEKSGFKIIE